jgi:hypothetical protein
MADKYIPFGIFTGPRTFSRATGEKNSFHLFQEYSFFFKELILVLVY